MKRKSCFPVGLTAGLILVCIGAFLVVVLVLWVPAQAEMTFGPASKSITSLERIILSTRLVMGTDQLRLQFDPVGEPKEFVVTLGESTYNITERLQIEGYIPDAGALRDYLIYAGMDTSIQAGSYMLSPRMTPIEIAQNLQDATPEDITFHILPGWRMEEIAELLPTSGLYISPTEFLKRARNPNLMTKMDIQVPANASLEGFLYPDSYRLARQTSLEALIATLLENFQIKVDHEMLEGFQQQGLTQYEGVILASIVEREAIVQDEMPMIASVFHNRLAIGMKLETDPTVQYALGYNADQATWWTNPLSLLDLETDLPFNTYRYPGLPPGPIANPGLNALQAVAFPAQTPYYYFRAACDHSGRHTFAETFEEHRNNACPEQ